MSVRHRIRCCMVVTNLSASLARGSFLRLWFCVWVEMMLSCCLIYWRFCSWIVSWGPLTTLLFCGTCPVSWWNGFDVSSCTDCRRLIQQDTVRIERLQFSEARTCAAPVSLYPLENCHCITLTLNYNIKHTQSFGHEAFNNAGQISHSTNQVKMYLT